MPITLGSLFDGSGGFPLAAALCGIVPVWASEVEPYPIAVTKSRFSEYEALRRYLQNKRCSNRAGNFLGRQARGIRR